MDTEDTTQSELPKAPAAALLFQAPDFKSQRVHSAQTEPVHDDPDEDDGPPSKKQSPKGRGSQSRKSGAAAKSGASGAASSDPSSKGSSRKKASGAKSGAGPAKDDSDDQRQDGGSQEDDSSQPDASGSPDEAESEGEEQTSSMRRRRRRPRSETQKSTSSTESGSGRQSASRRGADGDKNKDKDRGNDRDNGSSGSDDEVQALRGSTRLEAKRMRRRDGRRDSRRRQSITESEFLARRESVDREMIVNGTGGSDQIAVLEDGILVEHFVARRTSESIVGNIYLGKVQNVLPSMEAAFVDIGRGRNAVLYAGEVNWDALGMQGKPRRIEAALKPGGNVLVQVTKDPIGHKGARLTSQITLAGRYLVYVPTSSMLGISRKLPENERQRLKKLLRTLVPEDAGVIVRTAAEGATEEQLRSDVERLTNQWKSVEKKLAANHKAPAVMRAEPELVVRVVRDLFNEDVNKLIVQGKETWQTVHDYVEELSPELLDRVEHWTSKDDVFVEKRVKQQLAKAMDSKVWLPSGGTLIIERTEALTVVDVNTGKFVGAGGTLEETVTRNNLEAAEEIVRQLRLRDIGGIIIIDFVDMVLEANRELVIRRLVESLGRDRTRHQVTEITSLGLVQMTRKRVGEGLVEAFSTTCEVCEGRGFIVHDHPVETSGPGSVSSSGRSQKQTQGDSGRQNGGGRGSRAAGGSKPAASEERGENGRASQPESHVGDEKVKSALSAIAAVTVAQTSAEIKIEEMKRAEEAAATAQADKASDKAPAPTEVDKAADKAPASTESVEAAAPQQSAKAEEEPRKKPPRRRAASRPQGAPKAETPAVEAPAEKPPAAKAPSGESEKAAPAATKGEAQTAQAKKTSAPRSVTDLTLPERRGTDTVVKRPQRRRAVVTGPLDTSQVSSADAATSPVASSKSTSADAKGASGTRTRPARRKTKLSEEEAKQKEEAARQAVLDLLES